MIYSHLIPSEERRVNLADFCQRTALEELYWTSKTIQAEIGSLWKVVEKRDPTFTYTKELGFIHTETTIFVLDADPDLRERLARNENWNCRYQFAYDYPNTYDPSWPSPLCAYLDKAVVAKTVKRLEIHFLSEDRSRRLGANQAVVEYIVKSGEVELTMLDIRACWPARPERNMEWDLLRADDEPFRIPWSEESIWTVSVVGLTKAEIRKRPYRKLELVLFRGEREWLRETILCAWPLREPVIPT